MILESPSSGSETSFVTDEQVLTFNSDFDSTPPPSYLLHGQCPLVRMYQRPSHAQIECARWHGSLDVEGASTPLYHNSSPAPLTLEAVDSWVDGALQ